MKRDRRAFCAVRSGLLALVLAGCASVPPVPEGVPQVDPIESVVQAMEAERSDAGVLTPDQARSLQGRLPGVRAELNEALTWQEIGCYRRFWTHWCVSRVKDQRRRLEDRLARLDLLAAQALRHEAAKVRSQAEAQRIATEAAQDLAEQPLRAQRRLDYERKQEAAARARAAPPAKRTSRRPGDRVKP